jgi:hypothetical protein
VGKEPGSFNGRLPFEDPNALDDPNVIVIGADPNKSHNMMTMTNIGTGERLMVTRNFLNKADTAGRDHKRAVKELQALQEQALKKVWRHQSKTTTKTASVHGFIHFAHNLRNVWTPLITFHYRGSNTHRKKLARLHSAIAFGRQRHMELVVQRICKGLGIPTTPRQHGDPVPVLFIGNGFKNFNASKGKSSGPLMEVLDYLCLKMTLICSDEWGTTRNCLECGQRAKFRYPATKQAGRVTYCDNPSHPNRMLHRDYASDLKIAGRALAVSQEKPLPVAWQHGARLPNVYPDTNVITLAYQDFYTRRNQVCPRKRWRKMFGIAEQ